MDYIKTKSAYVKQTKHSLTNDGGVIFERDNSTLGGVNLISSTQYPIYTSGNFIISVDNTAPVKRKIEKISWESNGDSNIWTLNNIDSDAVKNDDASNEYDVVLKKDFFRLQDFAYYGSLSKFIEGSLTHIIETFPGELYIPQNKVGLDHHIYYESNNVSYILGDDGYTYPISNPFNIDLHSFIGKQNDIYDYKFMSIGDNYKNYVIIYNDEEIEITSKPVISEWLGSLVNGKNNLCVGDKICNININDNFLNIQAYLGEDRKIFYMVKETEDTKYGLHIRPKKEIYDNFEQNLSIFENYLLSKKESVKNEGYSYYQSVFEVIKETTNTYVKTLETFILPIDESGYNLDLFSSSYKEFVEKLSTIASIYDEKFTNNLYRSMTHESIKNFDWSFSRKYQDGDENEYVEGGDKFLSILNVCAREFDNVKEYIDSIVNVNVVTYDEKNNLPNYFLSDFAENKGWDVYNIFPFTLSEYILIPDEDGKVECKDKKFKKVFKDDSFVVNEEDNTAVYEDETRILYRYFSQDELSETIIPYEVSKCNPYGEFVFCDCESNEIRRVAIGVDIDEDGNVIFDKDEKFFYNECEKKLYERIKPYYSKEKQNINSINNEFLKRLCLNSNSIFKKKGTIDGIESILGMFGLKSKRWVDSLSDYQKDQLQNCENSDDFYIYDYTITEYTTFTTGIYDSYNDEKDKTWINWLNNTKLIPYNSYDNYEGLPVIAYKYITDDGVETNDKILYPYFSKDIDGNPYYQMKGGWLNKGRYTFDKENFIIKEEENAKTTEKLYTETHAVNRVITYLDEISSFNKDDFSDGDIMYVENLKKNYVIINGREFYEIKTENLLIDGNYENYDYITITASTNYCSVGDTEFSTGLFISNPTYYDSNNEQYVPLTNVVGNLTIKVYILTSQTEDESDIVRSITITDEVNKVFKSDISYFIDGRFIGQDENSTILDEDYTNYFILQKSENCNYIIIEDGEFKYGWEQLSNTDIRYHKLSTIIEKHKGNNPHVGHNSYDMGIEYINYYSQLFKYAVEKNLINPDCFIGSNYDYYFNEIISKVGFAELTDDIENIDCPSNYAEDSDCKIHSFCDIIVNPLDNLNENNDANRFFRNKVGNLCDSNSLQYKKYGTDDYHLSGISRNDTKLTIKTYECEDDADCGTYGYRNINQIEEKLSLVDEYDNVIISGTNVTDVTNQIMNIKRVDIVFNMHYKEYSEEDLKEKKYIEGVILPYMEQMLPTNIICRIDYNYLIYVDGEVTEEIISQNLV